MSNRIEASIRAIVASDDIDDFEHANHAVFLRYLDDLTWAQLHTVGLSRSRLSDSRRALVARKHKMLFHRSVRVGDIVLVTGTLGATGRVMLAGSCQMRIERTEQLVVTIDTEWVWLNLDNGLPSKLPAELMLRH